MKRLSYIAPVLALFLAILPATASANFDTSLRYGDSGPAVLEVQDFLADQGYFHVQPTGYFYSITLAAVKAFQTANSVSPVSGFWGPLTRAAAQGLLDQTLQQSNIEASTTPVVTQPITTPSTTATPSTTPQVTTTPTVQQAPTQSPAPAAAPQFGVGHLDIQSEGYYLNAINAPHTVAPASVKTWDQASDGQFAEMGVYVYNTDGTLNRTIEVDATTTDPTQDKAMFGTGTAQGYYSFNYLFRTAGTHTVTFTAGGVSSSVTMSAQ